MQNVDPGLLVSHALDRLSLGVLFLITVVVMFLLIELGYRSGVWKREHQAKAQHSQVRAIMGATLGLLAFMLAFTFATAQSHYETRVENMVEEARLANDAFLQAEFLAEPYRTQAREKLYDLIKDRVRIGELIEQRNIAEVRKLLAKSQNLQSELWKLGVVNTREAQLPGQAARLDPFIQSVIGLMDIHVNRLQAALMNRISWVIWATLYLTAILAMLVMGYQAGLVGKRSPMATLTLALAFALVMMLITDLDRPIMSLFRINDQVMVDLAARMEAEL